MSGPPAQLSEPLPGREARPRGPHGPGARPRPGGGGRAADLPPGVRPAPFLVPRPAGAGLLSRQRLPGPAAPGGAGPPGPGARPAGADPPPRRPADPLPRGGGRAAAGGGARAPRAGRWRSIWSTSPGCRTAEAEPRAMALAGEESRRPFDLARGPLFRARLLRLGAQDHVLLLCRPSHRQRRLVAGAAAAGLRGALQRLRRGRALAACRSRADASATSPASSGSGSRARGSPASWPSGASAWTAPPPSSSCPPTIRAATWRRRAAASCAFEVADPAAARFKALAQGAGATPFMAFLALFDLLLFRYTGQGDFIVGIPVANRHRTEFESVVGCFASTLLVRAGVTREATFRELLARVRGESLAVLAHSDLPFEKLVEELQPDRNLSHNPLFQVMFALQGAGAGKLALRGLELGAAAGRARARQARPDARHGGGPRRLRRLFRVQHRSLRAADDRPHGGPLRGPAGGGPGGARPRGGRAADALGRRSGGRSWSTGTSATRGRRRPSSTASPSRPASTPTRRRSSSATRRSPSASSTARPTGWPAACGGWASAPRCRWESASSARWRCPWCSSPCSRPAAPGCRSIPSTRRSGWR